MKSLQKRLSQLYEQQAIEEKLVLKSMKQTLDSLSPFTGVKNSISDMLSSDELEPYFSKKAFTLLMNKSIDSIIPKPDIINQTIKVLVQKRFVEVLFNQSTETSNVKEKAANCTSAEL
jgi:hypothetical protein